VTGNLVHLTYCLLGVGWLITTSVVAFTLLKLAGGAYLIFLGVTSLRPMSNTPDDVDASAGHSRKWWLQGLLNNLLNPKGPLFYLRVIAVFVHPESTDVYLLLLVCTTLGVSAVFWVLFVFVLQISSVRNRLLHGQLDKPVARGSANRPGCSTLVRGDTALTRCQPYYAHSSCNG